MGPHDSDKLLDSHYMTCNESGLITVHPDSFMYLHSDATFQVKKPLGAQGIFVIIVALAGFKAVLVEP